MAADGGRIPNEGEAALMLRADTSAGSSELQSTFQIAEVTRPLWSVGQICDGGLECRFAAKNAFVYNTKGKEVCRFERQPGKLYVGMVRLRNPRHSGFQRHG